MGDIDPRAAISRPYKFYRGFLRCRRAGCPHPAAVCRTISYISEQERQRKEKLKTMLHLDEVFSAEIYAKDALFAGEVKRGKEVLKPWVSSGVFFGTFFSLMKRKYEHSRSKS